MYRDYQRLCLPKLTCHRKDLKDWMDAIVNTINGIAMKSTRRNSLRNSNHSRHSMDSTQQLRLSRRTEYMTDDIHPEMTTLKLRQLEQWDMYVRFCELTERAFSELKEGSDFAVQVRNFIKRANQDLEEFVKDLISVESTGSSCLSPDLYSVYSYLTCCDTNFRSS